MSVLINMEMPTSCWPCHFQDCGNCVLNNHKVVDNCILEDRRDEECPLVPVPPHGDLIDRDALEKDIDNYIGGEESRSRFHHWVQVQSVVIPGDKGEET